MATTILRNFLVQPILQEALDQRGWNYKDLAERVGAAASTTNNWLNGKTQMGDDLLKRVADILNIPVDQLLKKQPEIDLENALRDDPTGTVDYWRARASRFEEKLAAIELAVRGLLQMFDQPGMRQTARDPINLISAGEAEAATRIAAQVPAEDLPQESRRTRATAAPNAQTTSPSAGASSATTRPPGAPKPAPKKHEP